MNKKTVTLLIDGQSASVPEGTLIVDAARTIGIDIPVFYAAFTEPGSVVDYSTFAAVGDNIGGIWT